jgi:uncharacterized oxidoreductase
MAPQNKFRPESLRTLCCDIFCAFGAPLEQAGIVADHLIESSLMGHESHGVTRCVYSAEEYKLGRLKPGAPVTVEQETPTSAIVNGHHNFGHVTAHKMVELAVNKARDVGMSCILSRQCHHIGRLGAWTAKIAQEGLFAMAATTCPKMGYWVVPFGGRDRRLATNPISWAAPTQGNPLVLDMTTSAISEGQVRACMNAGEQLPPGRIIDGHGRQTRDPNDLYGPPLGSILPFGGDLGYKAFGLSMLPMVFPHAMAGEQIVDEVHYINALSLMAVDPKTFGDAADYRRRVTEVAEFVKETPPAEGFEEVLLPGEGGYRRMEENSKTGIALPESTWASICDIAKEVDVSIPQDIKMRP